MRNIAFKKSFNCYENGSAEGIQLRDFAMHAQFVDPDYPADITEEVRSTLKDLHPSKVIGGGNFRCVMFRVEYSYKTKRGNDRDNYKYIFIPENDLPEEGYEREIIVQDEFNKAIEKFNFDNPYRIIQDVEITNIITYADAKLAIG